MSFLLFRKQIFVYYGDLRNLIQLRRFVFVRAVVLAFGYCGVALLYFITLRSIIMTLH